MNIATVEESTKYSINIQRLNGQVTACRGDTVLASSKNAKVMYETRLPPAIYFPVQDVLAELSEKTELQTFCPFKGTASYRDLLLGDDTVTNAVWSYDDALPESMEIQGHVAFMPDVATGIDIGQNVVEADASGHISGPMIDWLLREAAYLPTSESFTASLSHKLRENGVELSRLSVMIWSLHPMIAGKNYIWDKQTDEVTTFAPSYEIHDHPAFVNSPLRHVSNGLGGIRQKLGAPLSESSFPIMEDLRDKGATDYVAMPLPFSSGQINVLTLTSDHPDGFTTANLGLIFECSTTISRFYEVFMQKENAQSLLETYVGKRSGARVLGGDIRRGDGDEIDAAIMFCDMRNSTQLEEDLDRSEYMALLNHFFETVSMVIDEQGGEVLKFIGDAVLAVFPAGKDYEAACAHAVAAAREIVLQLNEQDLEGATLNCGCAIGIAFGRVTYGNVGSRERLDFTVVGRAANVAARLCDHGKGLGHDIVATQEVVGADSNCISLGPVALRNVSTPIEVFAVSAR